MSKSAAIFPTILLFMLLGGLLFVLARTPPFSESQTQASSLRAAARSPFDSQVHLTLANLYLEAGDVSAAQFELELAIQPPPVFVQVERVLGPVAAVHEVTQKIARDKIRSTQENNYWQTVTTKHPDYRDGWVQLYYGALLEENYPAAKGYLKEIFRLDPNFVTQLPVPGT